VVVTILTKLSKAENFPERVILTDDPLRAKMLWAHHLENAVLLGEAGDNIALMGSYNDTPIALVSIGSGCDELLTYLEDFKRFNVAEVIYMGECISTASQYPLRTVILANGGSPELLSSAGLAASKHQIPVMVEPTVLYGNAPPDYGGIIDTVTEAFYEQTLDYKINVLSVLTVSENTATGEQMEEHERRSRLYAAARLVFETFNN